LLSATVYGAEQEQSMQLVGLVVSNGFEVNSFAPLSVLEAANQILGERRYITRLLSERGGLVSGSLGVEVSTHALGRPSYDTLIVASECPPSASSAGLVDFLQEAAVQVRRIAAIRLGAFALAEAGLLNGRRATTHWGYVDLLRLRFPLITVEPDSLFVEDGPIWTSAGMTAGVDLALTLLERDIGPSATLEVARHLVVGQRRQARSPQQSDTLRIIPRSDRVQRALTHARANLRSALTVDELAAAACLSPRQFGRLFLEETGLSPARAVEKLRLDAAKLLVSQGRLGVETIADETGFGDAGRMCRAFTRAFGLSPSQVRQSADPHVNV
jgi:transcriptional regulator GlxA family with amidase domain